MGPFKDIILNEFVKRLRLNNTQFFHQFRKLINDDIRKWSRAYCLVRRNIVESMNSILRHARKLSITPLMESIRAILQKWFHNRRIFAERTVTPLTRRVLSILQKNSADSEIYTVESVDKYVYHVKGGTKRELLILLIRPVHVVGLTLI